MRAISSTDGLFGIKIATIMFASLPEDAVRRVSQEVPATLFRTALTAAGISAALNVPGSSTWVHAEVLIMEYTTRQLGLFNTQNVTKFCHREVS